MTIPRRPPESHRPDFDDLRDVVPQHILDTGLQGRGGAGTTIRYALARWPALCKFLDNGCIEFDNNPVGRAIRPVALGRKNHLFAGSDGGGQRWAIVASLLATAKLNDIEPYAYLKDVLQRMTDGHPVNRLDDLMPWNWKASNVQT